MEKIIKILIWVAILTSLYLYCYNLNANEKLDRVQQLYDLGLEKYEQGSQKQGCYLIRQSVRESWLLDDKTTHTKLQTLYEEICKSKKP